MTTATLNHFAAAVDSLHLRGLTAAEESLADEALLAMFKLRDLLVQRDANTTACRVDEAMSALERAARAAINSPRSGSPVASCPLPGADCEKGGGQ